MPHPSVPGLRYPDFLCIGAQKAGTTWLDANLRRHPGLWMPWIKELQYFNDVHIPGHRGWTGRHRQTHAEAAARRLIRQCGDGPLDLVTLHGISAVATEPLSDEWYGRVFAHAPPDRSCGEITPEYSLLPAGGIAHVQRLNPRMKIIFLMRDPVERCWSHLRMLSRGQQDFDFLAAAALPDVLARADYRRIIAAWTAAFGAEQVLTARIEEVAAAPGDFLARVVEFLGLPWHPAVGSRAGEPVFVGPELPMPAAVRDALVAGLSRHAA
ncbi:sulfotransferase [Roseomonas sp. CAU 1739]|uniref:sulfotransferase family protein n=1 Tax=Roseomonas sp. CAU 1739 TaxID=3140364 RepID=UPI00325A4F87